MTLTNAKIQPTGNEHSGLQKFSFSESFFYLYIYYISAVQYTAAPYFPALCQMPILMNIENNAGADLGQNKEWTAA